MPIKDRELGADQHKQAQENAVDELAKQAAHDAAIESKHSEFFSPADHRVKLKFERKKQQEDLKKQQEQNISVLLAQKNLATKSFSSQVRKEKAAKKSGVLLGV